MIFWKFSVQAEAKAFLQAVNATCVFTAETETKSLVPIYQHNTLSITIVQNHSHIQYLIDSGFTLPNATLVRGYSKGQPSDPDPGPYDDVDCNAFDFTEIDVWAA